MSDDRLQMPEQLEKAFEYLKQAPMPSDYELGKQRALLWEQIEKRGRRFRLLDRWWKPSVGALTAALVVVAALVVPHHLPDKGTEVKQGNMSASQLFLTQQQLDEERLNKTRMYAQQGKQFLETEHSTGIDLVIESPEKSNQNVLYAVKNGVSHQIYSYSKSYKIRSGIFPGTPMLEFEFFLDDKSDVRVDPNMYVLNPQTMQVKSLVWDAQESTIRAWMPTENTYKLVSLKTQLDGVQKVVTWDFNSGKFEEIYSTKEMANNVITLQHDLVLVYPKKLVRLSDSAPQVIDETTNTNGFNVITYGYGAFATDMVYSDGEIASISYGTYHGNVQLKQYSTETHQSRLLLPNVKGDQYIIAAPPSGELLVGNFVADNPSLAYTQQRTEVSGDMQLWYVNPNQPAKLVYTKKLKGEEIYRAFPSFTGDLVASTATDLLLVPDDNKVTSKSLRYQWDTQQVQEVDTEQAMQNSK